MSKSGEVWIAEEPPFDEHDAEYADPDQPPSPLRFFGYWEDLDPATGRVEIREQGPGWTSANAAVAWGRERAAVVYLRVYDPDAPPGRRDQYYSAGHHHPNPRLPRWMEEEPEQPEQPEQPA